MRQKSLAIIPARGESKRIPRKNIRNFLGQPVIKYSIDAALTSSCFEEIMVSTDDNKIAQVAKKCGARVPFLRSAATATDRSALIDVIEEVLGDYKKLKRQFDYFCCIYPASPLISAAKINQGFNLLIKTEADSVIPVVKFNYPIQRAFKIEQGKLGMVQPKNLYVRSQDLMSTYKDSGLFVWVKTKSFLRYGALLTKNTIAMEVSELESQDIDTITDWKIAELKFKLLAH